MKVHRRRSPPPALRVRADTLIKRPPAVVFQFVAENFFENYQRWSPEVVELQAMSAAPLTVGSKGRQVRVDLGRRSESTFRVSAFEAGKRLEFKGISDPYTVSYRFDELDGHTRLTFVFELYRVSAFIRPLEKRIQAALQKAGRRVVFNIKKLVELETLGVRVDAITPSNQPDTS